MSVRDELKQGLKNTFPAAHSIFGYYFSPEDDNDWVPIHKYWSFDKGQTIPQYARKFLEGHPDVYDFEVFEYLHEDALSISENGYNGNATWVLIIWVDGDGLHYLEVECFDEYEYL